MREYRFLSAMLLLAFFLGCTGESDSNRVDESSKSAAPPQTPVANKPLDFASLKPKLSDYDLFAGELSQLVPADDVVEYELNTPLFTDYAEKQRLIKLPVGLSAAYTSTGTLEFPVGTVIAKTFFYLRDASDEASPRQLIETRILEHRESGWIGIPYVWNDEQSDALLSIAGATLDVSRIDPTGNSVSHEYAVPNFNDCKRCHTGSSTKPIGPKAMNLNRLVEWNGQQENQLEIWSKSGWLTELPAIENVPQLVAWNDDSVSVDRRARAYLEVNCAHCHSPYGPARNSGLHLNIAETDPYHLGTFKTPIAAGKGTGGRLYGIVPGKPDESILEYRMRTTKPGEIMPEFGKSLVHREGLKLIRQWIRQMD